MPSANGPGWTRPRANNYGDCHGCEPVILNAARVDERGALHHLL
jgi:hypothetical protein